MACLELFPNANEQEKLLSCKRVSFPGWPMVFFVPEPCYILAKNEAALLPVTQCKKEYTELVQGYHMITWITRIFMLPCPIVLMVPIYTPGSHTVQKVESDNPGLKVKQRFDFFHIKV